jgi:hypothetical protein
MGYKERGADAQVPLYLVRIGLEVRTEFDRDSVRVEVVLGGTLRDPKRRCKAEKRRMGNGRPGCFAYA